MTGESDMTEEEWERFYFFFCEVMGEKPNRKKTFCKPKEEIKSKPKPSLWQRIKNFFK